LKRKKTALGKKLGHRIFGGALKEKSGTGGGMKPKKKDDWEKTGKNVTFLGMKKGKIKTLETISKKTKRRLGKKDQGCDGEVKSGV